MSADKPASGGRFLEGDAGIISGVFTTVGSLPYGVADDAGTGVCGGREGEEDEPDAAHGDAGTSEAGQFCVMYCMLRRGEADDSAISLWGTEGVICIARLTRGICLMTGSGNTATPTEYER